MGDVMNKKDLNRNRFMLKGKLAKNGYDWWWHSFTAKHEVTKEEKAFFVEYFIINPALNPNHVILGQSSTEAKPSYFMMKVGTWGKDKCQLHAFYPIKDMVYNHSTNTLKCGTNYYSENRLYGQVSVSKTDSKEMAKMTDHGTMKWDLNVSKQIAYNVGYGANEFFRKLNAFEMFWHAEGVKTLYDGYVIFNDQKYIVTKDTSYGYADKNWGKGFTSPWLWISSCDLYSEKHQHKLSNSALEIGGGQPKIWRKPLKDKILLGFYYEGEMIECNFTKFWKKSHIDYSFNEISGEAIWNIKARTRKYTMYINLHCDLDDMLKINYESPDGIKRHHHLLNGGNGVGTLKLFNNKELVDSITFRHTGCEYGEY